jgi:hypothetical protein
MITWTGLSFHAWSPTKMLHGVCERKIKIIENIKKIILRVQCHLAQSQRAHSPIYSRAVNPYLFAKRKVLVPLGQ